MWGARSRTMWRNELAAGDWWELLHAPQSSVWCATSSSGAEIRCISRPDAGARLLLKLHRTKHILDVGIEAIGYYIHAIEDMIRR